MEDIPMTTLFGNFVGAWKGPDDDRFDPGFLQHYIEGDDLDAEKSPWQVNLTAPQTSNFISPQSLPILILR
jgi:hypothetical protein